MLKPHGGAAVPRYNVFVMTDGSYVVQWEPGQAQELLSGNTRNLRDLDYGHAITDGELETLRAAGRVEMYDRQFVWLYPLPEAQRFQAIRTINESSGRVKYYYLNTLLPPAKLSDIRRRLAAVGLDRHYTLQERMGMIAVFGPHGQPFARLRDAEAAQDQLTRLMPTLLGDLAVAFVEADITAHRIIQAFDDVEVTDLETLIRRQNRHDFRQKTVVCIDDDVEFQKLVHYMLDRMDVNLVTLDPSPSVIAELEDLHPDLVLVDLMMPEVHGWEIISHIRQHPELEYIPIIIVSAVSSANDQTFGLTVAGVSDYLVKPILPDDLRQSVRRALDLN
jgi:CheY-like chemotaxis protein